MRPLRTRTFRALLCGFTTLVSFAPGAFAELVYGVKDSRSLVRWDSANPGLIDLDVLITGLQPSENIVGIDLRPATGQLFGLGSDSRVYTLDPTTGAATAVGGQLSTLLSGSNFGVDFNPTVDRIRVVSTSEQNLRLNPNTGAIAAVDTSLAYAAGDPNFGDNPAVSLGAYTNNFKGATTTTLYVIDTDNDVLATQVPPNNGTLNTVGSLGIAVSEAGGFDISGDTGIAYAGLQDTSDGLSKFYTINLATGSATLVGAIGVGPSSIITAMTVVPEAGSLTLLGLAGSVVVSVATFRRKRARR